MRHSSILLPVLLVTVYLSVGCQAQAEVKPQEGAKKNGTTSFNCIVCDDLTEKFCEPWDHFSHSQDCYKNDRIDKTKPVGCRKMVQKIGDKTYVSRQCTNLVSDDVQGCIDRVGTKKIKVVYCHCRDPDCNAGRPVARGNWALQLMMAMLGLAVLALGAR